MISNILLLLIMAPLLGAVFLLVLPSRHLRENPNRDREIALIASLVTFWLSIVVWFYFDNGNPDFQMLMELTWMPLSGTNFLLGIDGISLVFILLTTLLIPICILSSWDSVQHLTREFVTCLLVLESLLITVFSVLDVISFYIFFESTLIPMLLIIAVWGSRKEKIQAAYYLFLYTLVGSVLMLLGIFYLYYQIGTTDYQVLITSEIAPSVQKWLWLAFFASFAVKIPMIPFHIWLPQAHTEAHLSGSIVLAGILLKLGIPKLPKMKNDFHQRCLWQGFAKFQMWGRNRIGPHDQDIIGVIIGLLLGDGWLDRTRDSVRVCTEKSDSLANRAYGFWLNSFFFERGYVATRNPNRKTRKVEDKIIISWLIKTVKFTSWNWLYESFYPQGKKVVPFDILDKYISPLTLAIWFMDDGSGLNRGVKLATQGFTREECQFLVNLLNSRFHLKCSIHLQGRSKDGTRNLYAIYIWKQSMSDFYQLISPYLIPEMKYKLYYWNQSL